MTRTLAIALTLAAAFATGAQADGTQRGGDGLIAQIDGIASGGGRIERTDLFSGDGGLGTTR